MAKKYGSFDYSKFIQPLMQDDSPPVFPDDYAKDIERAQRKAKEKSARDKKAPWAQEEELEAELAALHEPAPTHAPDVLSWGEGSALGKSCYHTHPALVLGEFKIYGGNCGKPVVKDADIYIALQGHSLSGLGTRPWDTGKLVQEISYPIGDYAPPPNAKDFVRMVDWLCNQLQSGKKIHVGCIGGHGRTGTLLAAVTSVVLGEKDAITYVREHYCKKAVESREQIEFLTKHFGIAPAPEGKPRTVFTGSRYPSKGESSYWDAGKATAAPQAKARPTPFANAKRVIRPVTSTRCIWGTLK